MLVVDSEVDNVANEVTEMVVVNMEVDKVANMEDGMELGWNGAVVTLNGMVVGMCGMD